LSGIESRFGELQSQLGQLQSNIPAAPDLSGIYNRFGELESRLSNLPTPAAPDLSGLESRLGSLEQGIGSLRSGMPAPVDLSGLESRLGGLESRLSSMPAPVAPDFSGLESRLSGLESQLGNLNIPTTNLDPVIERLAALESRLSAIPTSFSPPPTNTNFDFGFGMQEGGEVPGQMMEQMLPNPMDEATGAYSELIDMTVAAIRGEVENPEAIIQAFVREFGNDAFRQLREAVLQEVVPNAQTEGMVEGMGGGQDDMVPGMIGTQRPVAVSPGEYIIPADVVAMAGGGYSGNGAEFFDGLVDDIRMKTMGTTEQVRPYQERLQ